MSLLYPTRRQVLAGILATSAPAALAPSVFTPSAALAQDKAKLSVAWNTGAICGAPVAAAKASGIFDKNNLDVEFINFAGSTEQMLESIATGKADVGIGMALRWLKPLEQGFDVKIIAGLHAGCLRLLSTRDSGVTKLEDLKGKVVAVSDLASPSKHFFAIQLAKLGLDPENDIDWRVYPGELLGAVVERGEAQAIAHWDPLTYQFLKSDKFIELGSNMEGEYANRACCIVGVRQALLEEQPQAIQALLRSLFEAQKLSVEHPQVAAEAYQPFSPNTPIEDLIAQISYHGHGHYPSGNALKEELAQFTADLKNIGVIRNRTDPVKFAEQIYAEVNI